jgi:cyclopropane fatty-acyl-phospholipid synthase-like methyltransferase
MDFTMKSMEECAVTSLDGSEKELFPYLPCILQDLWEMGSDPDLIIEAIERHKGKQSSMGILDLGCGKGAVSIKIAEKLHCNCLGIDAIKEFIEEAKKKSSEYGVQNLCTFEEADIRVKIDSLASYDVVVLGSIGPVLGDCYSTLSRVSKVLKPDGIIIYDDGYILPDSDYVHPKIMRKDFILQQIKEAGMNLIDELFNHKDDIKSSDDYIFDKIENRCKELIQQYPDKRFLFEDYIKKQIEENDVLENRIICSMMVIKRQ